MIEVNVKDNEPFEKALRRFKKKWEKAGVLKAVKNKAFYQLFLSHGKKICSTEDSLIFSDSNSFSRYRVYDPKGLFVGIVRGEKNSLTFKPEKIFNLNMSLN